MDLPKRTGGSRPQWAMSTSPRTILVDAGQGRLVQGILGKANSPTVFMTTGAERLKSISQAAMLGGANVVLPLWPLPPGNVFRP